MTIIEQIKAEIERLKSNIDDRDPLAPNQKAGYLFALADVLSSLSTLESEKPINQERLEENIKHYIEDCGWEKDSTIPVSFVRQIASHFYDLGCSRTAEKYDEIEYNRQMSEEHLADARKTSPNNLDEPVCEELGNETIRIEFKKIEHQCFEEGIVGWQKEKLIARHFYELGLNARKEEIK